MWLLQGGPHGGPSAGASLRASFSFFLPCFPGAPRGLCTAGSGSDYRARLVQMVNSSLSAAKLINVI